MPKFEGEGKRLLLSPKLGKNNLIYERARRLPVFISTTRNGGFSATKASTVVIRDFSEPFSGKNII